MGVISWVIVTHTHTEEGDTATTALLADGGREIQIKAPNLIYGRSIALTALKIAGDLEAPRGRKCHAVM